MVVQSQTPSSFDAEPQILVFFAFFKDANGPEVFFRFFSDIQEIIRQE